jgi:hypothetical protein
VFFFWCFFVHENSRICVVLLGALASTAHDFCEVFSPGVCCGRDTKLYKGLSICLSQREPNLYRRISNTTQAALSQTEKTQFLCIFTNFIELRESWAK